MTQTDLTSLIPAVVGLLVAITAWLRLEVHLRSEGSAAHPAKQVPDSHDQSCT